MESISRSGGAAGNGEHLRERRAQFQMPVHYPRYSRADYEAMEEWKVDYLLKEYGLPVAGDVEHKRRFAMGAFLWLH